MKSSANGPITAPPAQSVRKTDLTPGRSFRLCGYPLCCCLLFLLRISVSTVLLFSNALTHKLLHDAACISSLLKTHCTKAPPYLFVQRQVGSRVSLLHSAYI